MNKRAKTLTKQPLTKEVLTKNTEQVSKKPITLEPIQLPLKVLENKIKEIPEAYPKVSEFFNLLLQNTNKKALVVIKGYPDPDSISCALTFQFLANFFNIESTILYFDEISHHENKALVKKLGIELIKYNEDFDLSKYDFTVFNDTQIPRFPDEVTVPENLKPLILIDHHKNMGTNGVNFKDIRESSGSTSSIYCEYLIHGPITLTPDNKTHINLATALMHGIRSDTDNFIAAKEIDFVSASYLAPMADKDILSAIFYQKVSPKSMEITQLALQNKVIKESYLFSGVGQVREEERDSIGQAADYLLRREGIETVVVYGIVGNSFVDGSLRTTSNTVDPDKWLKDTFGVDQNGHFYGGGRQEKGGFQIPLGIFSHCQDKELLWQVVKKTVEGMLFEKVGVPLETEEE